MLALKSLLLCRKTNWKISCKNNKAVIKEGWLNMKDSKLLKWFYYTNFNLLMVPRFVEMNWFGNLVNLENGSWNEYCCYFVPRLFVIKVNQENV